MCSEEIYLLESAKNVLVSPMVNPGTSCNIFIDDKFYVWAKLTSSSSQEVVTEVDVGTALLLKDDGRQAAFEEIKDAPEPDCFSISIDQNFLDRGVFGVGLKASPSAAFHPLTTTEATEVATYNIQPSRIFEVAINERYKDGDELLSDLPPTLSVTVDLQTGAQIVIVVHSMHGATEDLSIEDPIAMKEMQEEMDRLNKEAEEKRQAAAEQKRKAAEKAAAEKAAAEKATSERTQTLQNQSIPSGHSIAATAWSAWHMRVYFQDGRGGIRESRHDDGVWSGGDVPSVLLTAKMGTPLSVINWDNGRQIRIYYLSSQNMLQEYCYSTGRGWYHGDLNSQWIQVAPNSRISAIHWHVDTSIRVYFQAPTSWAIQEYCYCGQSGWCRGSTLWNARAGSSIAATRWFSGALDSIHRNLHIRIYYQDEQSYIKELCWQVGGWSKGGFSQWAFGGTPIAAFAWYDYQVNIRVYWQDNYKALLESKYANGWSAGSNITNDVDERCPFTAVELQNGQHYRVYLRDRTALIEKCKGKYGGYWYNGVFVIR